MEDFDSLVVGGGLYGCLVAAHLAQRGERTLLVEKGDDLLGRASFANQARLHLGEPRSVENLRRFATEFHDCLSVGHDSFLAVGRSAPKLSASQVFARYREAGAFLETAPEAVRRWFDPAHIEAVFRVEEAAFDAGRLRERLRERLAQAGVVVRLKISADAVRAAGERLLVSLTDSVAMARRVFNCAYSQVNALMTRSGLPTLPLRHELAEMVQADAPAQLRGAGVTILSGPFFSLTPLPSTAQHAFGHTRFVPHAAWTDLGPDSPTPDEVLAKMSRQTGFERMRREASRYMPCLGDVRYQRSLWEVRTAPLDGGESLFRAHAGLRGLHCAIGTRVDCAYDILDRVEQLLG